MRVKFLKPHLDYNISDYADLDEGIGNYLCLMKVATTHEPDNAAINAMLDGHLAKLKPETKKSKTAKAKV